MTVSLVNPLPGQKFYLLVGDGAVSEAFTFLCVATTVSSKHGAEVEDAWVPDCNDPTALAARSSAVKGLTWDLTASGKCDPAKACYRRVIAAYRSGQPINLQLMRDLPGASGGDVEQSAFIVTDWSEGSSDRGLVTFDLSLRGQGYPTVTANA
ncbi:MULTISPECIES: phage tail tube protein [Methylosinus]|uniref:Phage tail protein n=1 Tax=Methylosinus trichosporium (strain ATCC 35070 / NCIMB 11131 / UNIQEM 75 / OB3b) TaxID=595536 RepID=A0A2D2CYF5_METT3|nr:MULTISPECIES: phage tail tube protein [Methylosinus]ATQ67734.1 hypothetical protein CQW49_07390 [Methylosinus trichosporium OB3b]OBS51158.1 hypothetical protein A8B73_17720 [Methylosinus sp. 3S-1]